MSETRGGPRPDPDRPATAGDRRPRRVDARGTWERWLRRRWREGPGSGLRCASVAYTLAADARHALYDTGVLRSRRAPIPVVSVGGLTVGGSGKTPVTADLARRLSGLAPTAVVTHGYPDEMTVHRWLVPAARITGSTDRLAAVERAAEEGARRAIVDGGFQHRRLWRDAEVVAVDAATAAATSARLPAGPYRERWSRLAAADAVVVSRREAGRGTAVRLAGWIRGRWPGTAVAVCRLRPGRLRPANEAARRADRPDPAVAVASIMNPGPFFRQLRGTGATPDVEWVFPDHGRPDAGQRAELVAAAGARGIAGTLKDVGPLREEIGGATPLWYLEERLVWEDGGHGLLRHIRTRLVEREGGR